MNEYQRQMVKEDAAVGDPLTAQHRHKEGADYVPARYDELPSSDDDEPASNSPRYRSQIARIFRKLFAARR